MIHEVLLKCMTGFYGSKNTHMNTRTRGFSLDHCAIDTMSGFNFGADNSVLLLFFLPYEECSITFAYFCMLNCLFY